jgi:hypothetical protein
MPMRRHAEFISASHTTLLSATEILKQVQDDVRQYGLEFRISNLVLLSFIEPT